MLKNLGKDLVKAFNTGVSYFLPVSYTHLRAHET